MNKRIGKIMEKGYFSHKEKKTNTDLKIKAWEIYGVLLLEKKIECFYALKKKKKEFFYDSGKSWNTFMIYKVFSILN